ncbi:hypothetical protein PRLR5107_10230 [Prevotella lacticifex]|uniref:Uncharacterized protein n=1 Tax=Prevotella lacticifex TaxID=2854755 RepID=A0A9R1CY20_9BACT|nr:hypothetical protein PRLR5003_04640 [Prevotella lacticifex]GJG39642.1 hypothetical protein PRLR5019_16130 [Prevotella lacticifex]GJG41676.1 hypothetical protein PRLR5025_04620 [Prevotella lacticifex]GJG45998.1 hypothetical protein PRLR5027_15930 [Prevotella lacticifex]GJG48027.1 hypothetical protein PRLR5052_04400 [Prevotella lacticifex]
MSKWANFIRVEACRAYSYGYTPFYPPFYTPKIWNRVKYFVTLHPNNNNQLKQRLIKPQRKVNRHADSSD